MATFKEWKERHGEECALRQFGFSDHMKFVIYPGKYVYASCGRYLASYPLGSGQDVEKQIERAKDDVDHCFDTFETITVDPPKETET